MRFGLNYGFLKLILTSTPMVWPLERLYFSIPPLLHKFAKL